MHILLKLLHKLAMYMSFFFYLWLKFDNTETMMTYNVVENKYKLLYQIFLIYYI